MPKSKINSSGKAVRKNRAMQIVIVVVLIAFAAYFIFFNVLKSGDTVNKDLENAMKNKTTYTFTKEGELIFTKPDEKEISEIDIEIADNDDKRMTGLMFRTSLKEDQGMLFIFPYETEQSFWMKNTVLSLDMIFVNSKNEIVNIHHNTTPFSEESYSSGKPAIYVVEVNAGYSNKLGIKEGDKILFRRN
jgi:hypothetical protein